MLRKAPAGRCVASVRALGVKVRLQGVPPHLALQRSGGDVLASVRALITSLSICLQEITPYPPYRNASAGIRSLRLANLFLDLSDGSTVSRRHPPTVGKDVYLPFLPPRYPRAKGQHASFVSESSSAYSVFAQPSFMAQLAISPYIDLSGRDRQPRQRWQSTFLHSATQAGSSNERTMRRQTSSQLMAFAVQRRRYATKLTPLNSCVGRPLPEQLEFSKLSLRSFAGGLDGWT